MQDEQPKHILKGFFFVKDEIDHKMKNTWKGCA